MDLTLVIFSAFPAYDKETVESTELGYKGTHLDNTLQINASLYQYVYENIHGQFQTESFLGGTSTSVRGFPEADTNGFEMDFIYARLMNFLLVVTSVTPMQNIQRRW